MSLPESSRPPSRGAADSVVARRITDLTGRVFRRIESWARMALIVTGALAAIAFVAALFAFRSSSWWGIAPAIVLLAGLGVPVLAAWMLRGRAKALHGGVDVLEHEIIGALQKPDLSAGLRSFLGDDDDVSDDGRAGLVKLAKGAIGVRQLVMGHRDTFGQLAGSVRAMAGAPLILAVITVGMFALALLAALFVLIAIF